MERTTPIAYEELKYLEEAELRRHYQTLVAPPPWAEFKANVDEAATPVDARVPPIYATLTLSFIAQGIQFPVLLMQNQIGALLQAELVQ